MSAYSVLHITDGFRRVGNRAFRFAVRPDGKPTSERTALADHLRVRIIHRVKDHDRLLLGLTGLARAGATDANSGHWGAAVLAAHFLCEEFVPDHEVKASIDVHLERLIVRFAALFEPVKGETECVDPEGRIAAVLASHGSHLRAIGHDVIFAALALALKALRATTRPPSRAIVDGIVQLLHRFDESDTGGPFFGYSDPRAVRVESRDDIPAYDSEAAIAVSALDGFAAIPRIYGGLHSGVVGHLLTLAYAAIEIGRLGYPTLAANAGEAHRRYRKLARQPPNEGERLGRDTALRVDPFDIAFWCKDLEGKRPWAFGHVFKYPYAYLGLIRCVGREPRPEWQSQLDLLFGWR